MNTQIQHTGTANPENGAASILSHSLSQLWNLVAHLHKSLAEERHRKVAVAHLMRLDDAMLRDIGIARGDIALMVNGRTREHVVLSAHAAQ